MDNDKLIAFGAGVGIGVLSIYAIVQLFPFIMLGGVGYIIYSNLSNQEKDDE